MQGVESINSRLAKWQNTAITPLHYQLNQKIAAYAMQLIMYCVEMRVYGYRNITHECIVTEDEVCILTR